MGGRRGPRTREHQGQTYQRLAHELARNVVRLRMRRGWNQEEAAHRCGLATRLLQRVEAAGANVTLTTIARLVEGLDVPVNELFKG